MEINASVILSLLLCKTHTSDMKEWPIVIWALCRDALTQHARSTWVPSANPPGEIPRQLIAPTGSMFHDGLITTYTIDIVSTFPVKNSRYSEHIFPYRRINRQRNKGC